MFEYQIILGRIGDIDGCIGAVFHIIIHNKYKYYNNLLFPDHLYFTFRWYYLHSAFSFIFSIFCFM